MTTVALVQFDALAPWAMSAKVSIRDEAFGALAYHHDTRRLVFLKSPQLVELVRRLGGYPSADAAVEDLIAPGERARYVRALASLATSEIISGG